MQTKMKILWRRRSWIWRKQSHWDCIPKTKGLEQKCFGLTRYHHLTILMLISWKK